MAPDASMIVHINAPAADSKIVVERECGSCQTDARLFCEHVPWYGWTVTCLSCGEEWQDGERMPRPFERGWREKRIAEAEHRLRAWESCLC